MKEKVVKISDIEKHIGQLLMLKEHNKVNDEYCKSISNRVHAIEKMLEMVQKLDVEI